MNAAQAFQAWRENMTHVRRLSTKTVEAYTHDVGGFLQFLHQHRGEVVVRRPEVAHLHPRGGR